MPTTPSTSRDRSLAGPDGALWFTNAGSNSIGRITTVSSVTSVANAGSGWATALTVTGAGFSAGETVKVKYLTGKPSLPLPRSCFAPPLRPATARSRVRRRFRSLPVAPGNAHHQGQGHYIGKIKRRRCSCERPEAIAPLPRNSAECPLRARVADATAPPMTAGSTRCMPSHTQPPGATSDGYRWRWALPLDRQRGSPYRSRLPKWEARSAGRPQTPVAAVRACRLSLSETKGGRDGSAGRAGLPRFAAVYAEHEVVVYVYGEVDLVTAPHLFEELAAAVELNGRVVIDLAGMSFIDSQGIRVLLDACTARSGKLLGLRLAVLLAAAPCPRRAPCHGPRQVADPGGLRKQPGPSRSSPALSRGRAVGRGH